MNAHGSRIKLVAGDAGNRVSYERPDLDRLLTGMSADQALRVIPSLLPVCARAQTIAATRAVERARGVHEDGKTAAEREALLVQEQAQAAAWRLLVDWPRLLGEKPELDTLKLVRTRSGAALAAELRRLLPGISEPPALQAYFDTRNTDMSLSGRVIAEAMRCSESLPCGAEAVELACLRGNALLERLRAFFDDPGGSLQALGQAEAAYALTVGPLAMARHPLSERLNSRGDIPPVARLLLAMLLDTHAIADTLDGARTLAQPPQGHGEHAMGSSCTARGPLYHHVELDSDDRVARWRYLSPTDWHFATGGMVDRLIQERCWPQDGRALSLLMGAADPCSPWQLRTPDGTPLREAA